MLRIQMWQGWTRACVVQGKRMAYQHDHSSETRPEVTEKGVSGKF